MARELPSDSRVPHPGGGTVEGGASGLSGPAPSPAVMFLLSPKVTFLELDGVLVSWGREGSSHRGLSSSGSAGDRPAPLGTQT